MMRQAHGLVVSERDRAVACQAFGATRRAAQILRPGHRDGAHATPTVNHGGTGVRGWKKLHLGVDGDGVIVGQRLTDASVDDSYVGMDLLGSVPGKIRMVIGDGAYDNQRYRKCVVGLCRVACPMASRGRLKARRRFAFQVVWQAPEKFSRNRATSGEPSHWHWHDEDHTGWHGFDRSCSRSSRLIYTITALLLGAGVLIGTRESVCVPMLSIIVWPLLAMSWCWGLRNSGSGAVADIRTALAIQIGFVLTMLSLYYVIPNPPSITPRNPIGIVESGTVTAYAGFPWTGVEGCPPYAWMQEYIPFDMGVDALLVNFAFWSVVAFLFTRRPSRSELSKLIVQVGVVTPFVVIAGVWQLVRFFD